MGELMGFDDWCRGCVNISELLAIRANGFRFAIIANKAQEPTLKKRSLAWCLGFLVGSAWDKR